MFRKAQMKVFAIITGILITLFIAVLGSINLIMRSVMQKQSTDILSRIAAGVEYNDKTSSFTFKDSGGFNKEHEFKYETSTSTAASTSASTAPQSSAPAVTAPTTSSVTTYTVNTTAVKPSTTPQTTHASSAPAVTVPTVTTSSTVNTTTETTTTTAGFPYIPPDQQYPTGPPEYDPNTNPWDPNYGGGGWDPNYGGGYVPPWNYWDYWNNWYFWNNWNYWNNWNKVESSEPEAQLPESTEPAEEPTVEEASEECTEELPVELSSAQELYGLPTLLGNTAPGHDEHRPDPQQDERDQPVPKAIGSIDFFIVMADKSGRYLSVLNNELAGDTAQNYIDTIMKKEVSSGMINTLQYHKENKNNGTLIVFTDKSAEIDMLNKLLKTTIMIGSLSVIILSIAAFFLSKKIMQPLKIAFDKQKQFVSDASHELKTPLTVISANADVLSDEIGENKWLTYIRSQTDRMSVLVNDLLNLTRLENNNSSDFVRRDFDLSKAIVNTALPFECQAFDMNKTFEVNVEDNIMVNGSEKHIRQMTAIFIDNALKYSDENGTVRVSLKKIGDRKFLSVYNSGNGISEAEKTKIFERFYRSDESRNRSTGGYGLGLSIAKSIIDKHKFKIHVQTDPGRSVSFIVIM